MVELEDLSTRLESLTLTVSDTDCALPAYRELQTILEHASGDPTLFDFLKRQPANVIEDATAILTELEGIALCYGVALSNVKNLQNHIHENAEFQQRSSTETQVQNSTTLFLTLALMVSDGVAIGEMRERLSPLVDQDCSDFYDSSEMYWGELSGRLDRLVADLTYLEMIRGGGLESINRHLEDLFCQLKAAGGADEIIPLGEQMNDCLHRAIYLYPHLATGVEVQMVPDIGPDAPEYTTYRDREEYLKWVSEMEAERGEAFSGTITLPLPYVYRSRSHGSGFRSARAHSRPEVEIEHPMRQQHGHLIDRCVVNILGDTPLEVGTDRMVFLGSEIERVRFVSNTEPYTPYQFKHRVDQSAERKLRERGEPIGRYLEFRGFTTPLETQLKWRAPQMDQAEWFTSFLLFQHSRTRSDKLEHAMIVMREAGNRYTLFDVSDQLLTARWTIAELTMKRITGAWKGRSVRNIEVFRDEEIVSHLALTPVEKRDF